MASRSHGAYRIAHVLREHDWDIEVIDYTHYWSSEQLKQLARSRITDKTRWIGISLLFSTWTSEMEEFFHWIKTQWPHLIIVCGGPTRTAFETSVIDYYMQGYSENAIIALLRYLFSNGPRPRFDVSKVNQRPIIPANDYYPTHPVKELMVRYEDRDFINPGEFLSVEFARGCKFACAFCNYPIIGVKGDYSRDAEDFRLQMMDAYDRFGVTNYLVTDETFNDRTEKITKFANVVQTLPFSPWFTGTARVDLLISRPLDREELMRMNFLGQFYGVESFHAPAVKAIGKGMDPERVKQGLLDIRKYFETASKLYRGHVNLIIGLPDESIESIMNSKTWLENHWHGQAVDISALTIYCNENTKKSKMSEDYAGYGYTVMQHKAVSSLHHFDATEDTIAWQNNRMNVYQAQEIEQNWISDLSSKESVHRLHSLNKLCHPILSNLPIEKRLEFNNWKLKNLLKTTTHDGFVDRYIHQKLSL
jgi:radical SAM superfamily enzyme YgiQ (UPF0313 family)